MDAEFVEEAPNVGCHSPRADIQHSCDRLVWVTGGDETDDFILPRADAYFAGALTSNFEVNRARFSPFMLSNLRCSVVPNVRSPLLKQRPGLFWFFSSN